MPNSKFGNLPVEVVQEIVRFLALPPEWPYCVRSTYGSMTYESRHVSIFAEPFNLHTSYFPTGLLALSKVNKYYRELCEPFLRAERVIWDSSELLNPNHYAFRRFVKFLEVGFPRIKASTAQPFGFRRVMNKQYENSALMRGRIVSQELESYQFLTSLQLINIPLNRHFIESLSKMSRLKALTLLYCHETSQFLDTLKNDRVTTENFEGLPPIESLRLRHPYVKALSLAVSLNKNLQHLVIERENPNDAKSMDVLLKGTRFPLLQTFMLTGPAFPSKCVQDFVISHRRTLREVNISWTWPSATFTDMSQILMLLRSLAGDLEDIDIELERRGLNNFLGQARWSGYIATGFGCVFRDRVGCEGRDLVELGLCVPPALWPDRESVNVDFRLAEFRGLFEEKLFRTLERLTLMLPPQTTPEVTVEDYMHSIASLCSNFPYLQTLTIEPDVEEMPWSTLDRRQFLFPLPPNEQNIPDILETDEYAGFDWGSLTNVEDISKQWWTWEELNHSCTRRFMTNIMRKCPTLKTIEWYIGLGEETGDIHSAQARWLWRKVRQRRKKDNQGSDNAKCNNNDVERMFVVGDLMIPGTPGDSRRSYASPLVGRCSDLETRLFGR